MADKPAQRMRFEVVVFILVLLMWAFAEPEVGVERRSSPGAPSVRWLDHTVVRDVLDSPSPHLVIEFGHFGDSREALGEFTSSPLPARVAFDGFVAGELRDSREPPKRQMRG